MIISCAAITGELLGVLRSGFLLESKVAAALLLGVVVVTEVVFSTRVGDLRKRTTPPGSIPK